MPIPTNTKASPEPPLPAGVNPHDADTDIVKPASNATHQLEKPRVRRKAHEDQTTLLEKGANALPVSDYPLKTGLVAANNVDLRQRARSRHLRRSRRTDTA